VFNSLSYGGVQAGQYPLTIYSRWFQRFFTFVVPLAAVTYFPAVAILGRNDPLGTSRIFQHVVPLIGVAFLAVSLQVWKIGVRHYRSTGS
jgi:ABC-2 type transport system permease protein